MSWRRVSFHMLVACRCAIYTYYQNIKLCICAVSTWLKISINFIWKELTRNFHLDWVNIIDELLVYCENGRFSSKMRLLLLLLFKKRENISLCCECFVLFMRICGLSGWRDAQFLEIFIAFCIYCVEGRVWEVKGFPFQLSIQLNKIDLSEAQHFSPI